MVYVALPAAANEYGLTVTSITGVTVAEPVRITLDTGAVFLTHIASVPIRIDSDHIRIDDTNFRIDSTETLELADPLPASAAVGRHVVLGWPTIAATSGASRGIVALLRGIPSSRASNRGAGRGFVARMIRRD